MYKVYALEENGKVVYVTDPVDVHRVQIVKEKLEKIFEDREYAIIEAWLK